MPFEVSMDFAERTKVGVRDVRLIPRFDAAIVLYQGEASLLAESAKTFLNLSKYDFSPCEHCSLPAIFF